MIYNKNITPGERWHPAAEESGKELFDLVATVRTMMNRRDIFTLSGKTMGVPSRFRKIGIHPSPKFVVEDRETGLYLKGDYARDANIHFDTMNYLHEALNQRSIGIIAMQALYVVVPESFRVPAVTIMPPATGRTLDDLYSMGPAGGDDSESLLDIAYSPEHKRALKDVKKRLDTELTRQVRKTLVSDFHGGNILLDSSGLYTIIDQPHPYNGYRAEAWLETNQQ